MWVAWRVQRQDGGPGLWRTAVCLLVTVLCCTLGNCWEGKFCFVFFCHHFLKKEYYTGENILLHSIMYNCFVATKDIILSKKKPF